MKKNRPIWNFVLVRPRSPARFFLIAFILSVIVHSFFYWKVDELIQIQKYVPKAQEEAYAIEYAPPTEVKRHYMETNEQVTPHEPENTPFYSERSQIAAQEHPQDFENSHLPNSQGEREQINSIFETPLVEQSVTVKQAQISQEAEQQQTPKANPRELANVDRIKKPLDERELQDEFGTGLSIDAVEEEETQDIVYLSRSEYSQKVEQTPQPRPRPKVDISRVPGASMKHTGGTRRLGLKSVDAQFSQFAGYERRMIESIVYQWHSLLTAYQLGLDERGGEVLLSFTINMNGEIENLQNVKSTATHLAELICQDAVDSVAPFGHWTDDMVEEMGQEKVVHFLFSYK